MRGFASLHPQDRGGVGSPAILGAQDRGGVGSLAILGAQDGGGVGSSAILGAQDRGGVGSSAILGAQDRASPESGHIRAGEAAPFSSARDISGSGSGSGVGILVAALALALAGCEARLAHPFGAYVYEADGGPEGGCLLASGIVDVIEGPAPAAPCKEVRCWQGPDGNIYVTDGACDAPADYQDRTQDTSGPCAQALAAYGADGGRVLCPPAPDAGS